MRHLIHSTLVGLLLIFAACQPDAGKTTTPEKPLPDSPATESTTPQPPAASTNGDAMERLKKEASEAFSAARDAFNQQKDKAFSDIRSRLGDLDEKINQIGQDMKNEAPEIKARREENMRKIREAKAALDRKVQELGKASAETWDTVQKETEKAYQELKKSIDDFMAAP